MLVLEIPDEDLQGLVPSQIENRFRMAARHVLGARDIVGDIFPVEEEKEDQVQKIQHITPDELSRLVDRLTKDDWGDEYRPRPTPKVPVTPISAPKRKGVVEEEDPEVSKQRQKGTLAETAFVKLLEHTYWPNAERSALRGANDRGDTTGHPGLVFEVKSLDKASYPALLVETEKERQNAKADFGILVHKPTGVGTVPASVPMWYAVMRIEDFEKLLLQGDSIELIHVMGRKRRLLDLRKALIEAQNMREMTKPGALYSAVRVESRTNSENYYVCRLGDMLGLLNRAGYGTKQEENGS